MSREKKIPPAIVSAALIPVIVTPVDQAGAQPAITAPDAVSQPHDPAASLAPELDALLLPQTIEQSMANQESPVISPIVISPKVEYIVSPEETLSAIAEQTGVPVAEILALNPEITNPDTIDAGQRIRLPKNGDLAKQLVEAAQKPPSMTPNEQEQHHAKQFLDAAAAHGLPVSHIDVSEDPSGALTMRVSLPGDPTHEDPEKRREQTYVFKMNGFGPGGPDMQSLISSLSSSETLFWTGVTVTASLAWARYVVVPYLRKVNEYTQKRADKEHYDRTKEFEQKYLENGAWNALAERGPIPQNRVEQFKTKANGLAIVHRIEASEMEALHGGTSADPDTYHAVLIEEGGKILGATYMYFDRSTKKWHYDGTLWSANENGELVMLKRQGPGSNEWILHREYDKHATQEGVRMRQQRTPRSYQQLTVHTFDHSLVGTRITTRYIEERPDTTSAPVFEDTLEALAAQLGISEPEANERVNDAIAELLDEAPSQRATEVKLAAIYEYVVTSQLWNGNDEDAIKVTTLLYDRLAQRASAHPLISVKLHDDPMQFGDWLTPSFSYDPNFTVEQAADSFMQAQRLQLRTWLQQTLYEISTGKVSEDQGKADIARGVLDLTSADYDTATLDDMVAYASRRFGRTYGEFIRSYATTHYDQALQRDPSGSPEQEAVAWTNDYVGWVYDHYNAQAGRFEPDIGPATNRNWDLKDGGAAVDVVAAIGNQVATELTERAKTENVSDMPMNALLRRAIEAIIERRSPNIIETKIIFGQELDELFNGTEPLTEARVRQFLTVWDPSLLVYDTNITDLVHHILSQDLPGQTGFSHIGATQMTDAQLWNRLSDNTVTLYEVIAENELRGIRYVDSVIATRGALMRRDLDDIPVDEWTDAVHEHVQEAAIAIGYAHVSPGTALYNGLEAALRADSPNSEALDALYQILSTEDVSDTEATRDAQARIIAEYANEDSREIKSFNDGYINTLSAAVETYTRGVDYNHLTSLLERASLEETSNEERNRIIMYVEDALRETWNRDGTPSLDLRRATLAVVAPVLEYEALKETAGDPAETARAKWFVMHANGPEAMLHSPDVTARDLPQIAYKLTSDEFMQMLETARSIVQLNGDQSGYMYEFEIMFDTLDVFKGMKETQRAHLLGEIEMILEDVARAYETHSGEEDATIQAGADHLLYEIVQLPDLWFDPDSADGIFGPEARALMDAGEFDKLSKLPGFRPSGVRIGNLVTPTFEDSGDRLTFPTLAIPSWDPPGRPDMKPTIDELSAPPEGTLGDIEAITGGAHYTVGAGDWPLKIAREAGISLQELYARNPGLEGSEIWPGDTINLSSEPLQFTSRPKAAAPPTPPAAQPEPVQQQKPPKAQEAPQPPVVQTPEPPRAPDLSTAETWSQINAALGFGYSLDQLKQIQSQRMFRATDRALSTQELNAIMEQALIAANRATPEPSTASAHSEASQEEASTHEPEDAPDYTTPTAETAATIDQAEQTTGPGPSAQPTPAAVEQPGGVPTAGSRAPSSPYSAEDLARIREYTDSYESYLRWAEYARKQEEYWRENNTSVGEYGRALTSELNELLASEEVQDAARVAALVAALAAAVAASAAQGGGNLA